MPETKLLIKNPDIDQPPTFEGEMEKFDAGYNKLVAQYPDEEDGDLFVQHYGNLCKKIFPIALELANSRLECHTLFDKTPEGNGELHAEILKKMETFPVSSPKPQK